MKALFIGGTGTISMAIVRRLAEKTDWEVWLLNRGRRAADVPEGVRTITADISNEKDVAEKLKDMIQYQEVTLLLKDLKIKLQE